MRPQDPETGGPIQVVAIAGFTLVYMLKSGAELPSAHFFANFVERVVRRTETTTTIQAQHRNECKKAKAPPAWCGLGGGMKGAAQSSSQRSKSSWTLTEPASEGPSARVYVRCPGEATDGIANRG